MARLQVVGDEPPRKPGRPAADEFDPWDTETSNEYSIEKFYTRSTNKFDHSKDVRSPVPSHIHGAMMALVDDKKFASYKCGADIVRDALVHRLRTIHGWIQDDELLKVLSIEERISRQDLDEAEVTLIESLMEKYRNYLEKMSRLGDIRRLSGKLDEMEDWAFYLEPPYQQQALDLIHNGRVQLKMLVEKESKG